MLIGARPHLQSILAGLKFVEIVWCAYTPLWTFVMLLPADCCCAAHFCIRLQGLTMRRYEDVTSKAVSFKC